MASAKPVIHGRDHHHGGADPIANFIEYDYLNVGDWLNIVTTGDDGAGTGIAITAQNAKKIVLTGDGGIDLDTATMTVQNLGGAGTGLLTVQGYDLGMNFTGGFTEFAVAGFEVDSTLGVSLNDTSAAAAGSLKATTTSNYIQLLAGADHGHTHTAGDVAIEADGQINLYDHGDGINIEALGGGIVLNAASSVTAVYPGSSTRPIVLVSEGAGTSDPAVMVGLDDGDAFYIFRNSNVGGTRIFSVSTNGVVMNFLPTSSPGIAGHVWNNGGVLNIV